MRNISRSLRHGAKKATSFPSIVIDKIQDRVSVRLSTNGAIYRNLKLVGGPVSIGQLVYTDFTTPEPTVVAPGIDYAAEFEELAKRIEEPLPPPPGTPLPVYEQGMIEVWLEGNWYMDSKDEVYKIGVAHAYYPVSGSGLQAAIEDCPPYGLISIPNTPTGITGDFDFWYYQSIVGKGRNNTQIYGQQTFRNGCFVQDLTIDHDTAQVGPGHWIVGIVSYGDLLLRDINLLCYCKSGTTGSGIGLTNTEMTSTWIADGCFIKADIGVHGNLYGAGEAVEYMAQGAMAWTYTGFDLPERGFGVSCEHALSKHKLHWYGKYFEMTSDIWQIDVAAIVLKSTLYEGGNTLVWSSISDYCPSGGNHESQHYDHHEMWWGCSGSTMDEIEGQGEYGWLSSASNGSDFGELNIYKSNYQRGYSQRGMMVGHYLQDQSFWHYYLNASGSPIADPMWAMGFVPGYYVPANPRSGSDYTPQIPFQARTFWDEKDAKDKGGQDGWAGGDNYGPGDLIHFSFDTMTPFLTERFKIGNLEIETQMCGLGSAEFEPYHPEGTSVPYSGSSFPGGQVPRLYCDWRYKSQEEYTYFWMTRAGGLIGANASGSSSGSNYTSGSYIENYFCNDHKLSHRLFALQTEPKYWWMTRPNGKKVWYVPTLFNGRMTNCAFQSAWIDIDATCYSFIVVDDPTFNTLHTTLGTVVNAKYLDEINFNQDAPADPFPYQMWFPQPY